LQFWARGKKFFGKSIKVYKNNENMKNFKTFFKSMGVEVLSGLWVLQKYSLANR